jgi:CO/xanthine dehydrogenase Mo-binding subunit
MLWGKMLRSPHPHARIRRIDASAAWRVPGVKAVVTGQDVLGYYTGAIANAVDGLTVRSAWFWVNTAVRSSTAPCRGG